MLGQATLALGEHLQTWQLGDLMVIAVAQYLLCTQSLRL
jgi:hypothetical protein